MTNYMIDRNKLKEILLSHKAFISQRCKKLISQGVNVSTLTYGETEKFTDEFIDTIIDVLPLDSLLDEVDELLNKTIGKKSKDYMDIR
jgi:hypothetical protein